MRVKAGEFKHPIIIERCITTLDSDNIPREEWSEILRTRARITNISAKEYIGMNGDVTSISSKFTIRVPRLFEIANNDRIVYKGNYYNIKYCNNIMELGLLLELVAEVIS